MLHDQETARGGVEPTEPPFHIDAERIGGLVDGRVRGQERRALVAEIAASGEAIEVLADTAVVSGELEETVCLLCGWSRQVVVRPELSEQLPCTENPRGSHLFERHYRRRELRPTDTSDSTENHS